VKKLLPHQWDWVDSTDFVVLKFAVVTILVADWGVAHLAAVAHLVDLVEVVAVVVPKLRNRILKIIQQHEIKFKSYVRFFFVKMEKLNLSHDTLTKFSNVS
jgi:hypothetical protein